MNLRHLRIGTRLAVGFGVILATLVLILVIDSIFSASNRKEMVAGLELSHSKSELAATMKSSMLESGIAIRNIGLQTDLGESDKQNVISKKQQARFAEAREKLIALGLSAEEKKIIDAVSDLDKQIGNRNPPARAHRESSGLGHGERPL